MVPLLAIVLLLPPPLAAEIYSFRDSSGVIHLSDRPPQSGSYRTLRRGHSGDWGIQQVRRDPVGRSGYTIRDQFDRFQLHGQSDIAGENSTRYHELVRSTADRHGIDQRLLSAVIEIESGFNRLAVSSAGAQGLMQLMPATALMLGVNDPFDPYQNVDGGARHLRGLIDRFGRLDLALAAYNAGENAVIQAGNRIPPYPETRRYVKKVLGVYYGN